MSDERSRILHALHRADACTQAMRISVGMPGLIGTDGPQALLLVAAEILAYGAAFDAVKRASPQASAPAEKTATQPIYDDEYWQGLRWLNGDES